MEKSLTKRYLIIALIAVVLVIGIFALVKLYQKELRSRLISVEELPARQKEPTIIGQSVEGRSIEAYTYGIGDKHLLFVGDIHGGYEWNSALLAYQFIDYLEAHPDFLPANLKVTIIPSLNPDGLYKVTGKNGRFKISDVSTNQTLLESARFNAREVDLNRNFDCKWKPNSTWKEKPVSAGTKAFSEPEAMALQKFILKQKPVGVVFWHSQANAVYASECEAGILPETLKLVDAYSQATSYQAIKTFDNYEVTGDAEGWLASIGIPAITVELKNHTDTEWESNLAGIKALVDKIDQL